jgi:hypothetical protein
MDPMHAIGLGALLLLVIGGVSASLLAKRVSDLHGGH